MAYDEDKEMLYYIIGRILSNSNISPLEVNLQKVVETAKEIQQRVNEK